MTAYYNEFDPYAAQWLRNLIEAGAIAPGVVDERSINDVRSADLAGFEQCHFFAGIGGWSLALRLAGWPDARPVWTGSCPCQPFSAAGRRRGAADHRHLWPVFRGLIAECAPTVVFGEQVASKDGRCWLDGVRNDLEGLGYAVGAADLCAAGLGAPHIRQRLWWVADSHGGNGGDRYLQRGGQYGLVAQNACFSRLADVRGAGLEGRDLGKVGYEFPAAQRGAGAGGVVDAEGEQVGLPGRSWQPGSAGFWSAFDVIPCTDGKARRVEPGTFPLAHGVSGRVGKLRAYGNAIVPQVAAEFIGACLDAGCGASQ